NTQFSVAATSSSGLPISYSSSGPCTNSGATFTMTSGTGICTVKYNQSGDANHNAAPQIAELASAQQTAQTITFDQPANKTFGEADFGLNASASSGLSVTLRALGNCSVSGNTIHLTGAGSCSLTASQSGNSDYGAAADVARSFTIAKAEQSITFNSPGNKTFGEADFGISATASSGLAVSLSVAGQCSISAGLAHLAGAGTCTVTASQSGDSNYNAAPDVQRSFQIDKGAQTINFDSLS